MSFRFLKQLPIDEAQQRSISETIGSRLAIANMSGAKPHLMIGLWRSITDEIRLLRNQDRCGMVRS